MLVVIQHNNFTILKIQYKKASKYYFEAFLITTITFSQNKKEHASLEVNGVCMMCINRME